VSSAEGHAELIASSAAIPTITVGDRAGLARQTLRLLDNQEFARAAGDAGRAYVAGVHDPRRIIQQYTELYRQLGD
jgi:hypothetical protein